MIAVLVIATIALAIVGDVLTRDRPTIGRHTAAHFEAEKAKAAAKAAESSAEILPGLQEVATP